MTLRPVVNLVLAATLVVAGLLLLQQDSFFLRERWEPAFGMRFSGWSLRFLAGALFGLAAFAGAVGVGWLRGSVPLPPARVWVHPTYKGQLVVRYWPLLALTFTCLALAFGLADRRVPNPALAPPGPMETADRVEP
jgi:hypothetical protein